ncbi:MAG TPA: molybdenum cofactor guanylyltransferase [Methanocorpusculum sp.]|nr:molybdenum cofactor guanylyltransferase [Methanocorpusculum sp.]
MAVKRSAMILAGGEAKRADGREKYFFSYKGCSFIARLVHAFEGIADEIVIVAKSEKHTRDFQGLPDIVRCTWDREPGRGPVGGISTGIDAVKGETVFIAACDMPTINSAIVTYLFDNIGDYDAIIPQWENTDIEPLHAVYKAEAVRKYMKTCDSLQLRKMVDSLNTKRVSPEELRRFDPDLETFRNINTLAELKALGPEAAYKPKNGEK